MYVYIFILFVYRRSRADEPRRLQLLQIIRSGYLHEWLNKLELQAGSLQGTGRITRTSEARLLEALESVARMRRQLVHLSV
jgi:hypothetical protein